jgi:hypothetical protein
MDLGIEVLLKLFSKEGLKAIAPKKSDIFEDKNLEKIAFFSLLKIL